MHYKKKTESRTVFWKSEIKEGKEKIDRRCTKFSASNHKYKGIWNDFSNNFKFV